MNCEHLSRPVDDSTLDDVRGCALSRLSSGLDGPELSLKHVFGMLGPLRKTLHTRSAPYFRIQLHRVGAISAMEPAVRAQTASHRPGCSCRLQATAGPTPAIDSCDRRMDRRIRLDPKKQPWPSFVVHLRRSHRSFVSFLITNH